jgi:hypothetical protein
MPSFGKPRRGFRERPPGAGHGWPGSRPPTSSHTRTRQPAGRDHRRANHRGPHRRDHTAHRPQPAPAHNAPHTPAHGHLPCGRPAAAAPSLPSATVSSLGKQRVDGMGRVGFETVAGLPGLPTARIGVILVLYNQNRATRNDLGSTCEWRCDPRNRHAVGTSPTPESRRRHVPDPLPETDACVTAGDVIGGSSLRRVAAARPAWDGQLGREASAGRLPSPGRAARKREARAMKNCQTNPRSY